jgi:hypothetical protein
MNLLTRAIHELRGHPKDQVVKSVDHITCVCGASMGYLMLFNGWISPAHRYAIKYSTLIEEL